MPPGRDPVFPLILVPQTSQKSSLAESWPRGHAVIPYRPFDPPIPLGLIGRICDLRYYHSPFASPRSVRLATARAAQDSGLAVGAIGAGRPADSWSPHRYASTAAAALRPSAMAQTIIDWPPPMSPAPKTTRTHAQDEPSRA